MATPTLPYRLNAGAVLFNPLGFVFMGHRIGAVDGWQLPQGGIADGEDPRVAVLRELAEEIGTTHFHVVAEYPEWLSYESENYVRDGIAYRGQKQKWFALRFVGTDLDIRIDYGKKPEFDTWHWVDLASVVAMAPPFKRPIYEKVVSFFSRYA